MAFLQRFRHATEITDADPYKEIGVFLATQRDKVDEVFRTLSYFDGVTSPPAATRPRNTRWP